MTQYRAPLAVLLFSLSIAPAAAQEPVAVTGLVTDSSGGVLQGATVEARRGLRLVSTTATGGDGRYRLDLPETAPYRLTARLDGFETAAAEVTATGPATADFRLDIAPVRDTVVVTASRTAEVAASVTESHSVFTAEDIESLGSHSVADVLRYVPGLNVESTGREGSLTSVFARGGESDYNHVLIDGVRVNDNGGGYDFDRVSAAEIERVEVVRGAQSALYGSDAIGSVIQIFTKRGTPDSGPRLSGSFEGGSFGTTRGDVRVLGGAADRVDYQLGVAHRATDGAFQDRLVELDRFDQQSIDGNLGAIVGDNTRLRGGFRYSNRRGSSVGPIVYAPGDTGGGYDTDALTWHLDFDQTLSPRFSHSATVSHFRSGTQSVDTVGDPPFSVFALLEGEPGALYPAGPRLVRLLDEPAFDALATAPSGLGPGQFLARTGPYSGFDYPFDFETQLRRPAVRYQANATWLDDQVLSVGYDYYSETNALDPLQTVENHSYFLQQQFNVADAWFVTGGARVDDNSLYGTAVNPKLSAGGYPLPYRGGALSSVKVSANVGRGIKNPTFSQLYGSQWVDGDLSLLPEQAVTVDAGAELTFDDQRWLARFNWFSNDYEDQIAYSPSLGFGGDGVADLREHRRIAGGRGRARVRHAAAARRRDGQRLLRAGGHRGGDQREHERAVPAGPAAPAPAPALGQPAPWLHAGARQPAPGDAGDRRPSRQRIPRASAPLGRPRGGHHRQPRLHAGHRRRAVPRAPRADAVPAHRQPDRRGVRERARVPGPAARIRGRGTLQLRRLTQARQAAGGVGAG